MSAKGISKDLIGTKLDRYEFDVERGKIREFCQAIGETNPIYFDVEAAKKRVTKTHPPLRRIRP